MMKRFIASLVFVSFLSVMGCAGTNTAHDSVCTHSDCVSGGISQNGIFTIILVAAGILIMSVVSYVAPRLMYPHCNTNAGCPANMPICDRHICSYRN